MVKKKSLGKGLRALIGDVPDLYDSNDDSFAVELPIGEIYPNSNQPRKEFSDDSMTELENSIAEVGVLQPIAVKKVEAGYEIIAGERRWRAAMKVGISVMPAIILQPRNDAELMEMSLIENLQREDLNPIEQAEAFQQLLDLYDLSQEELAKKLSKSRTSLTNTIRLLNLPREIRESVKEKVISAGHARALLSLSQEVFQVATWRKIINGKWSVRQTEEYVKNFNPQSEKKKKTHLTKVSAYQFLEDELREIIGNRVKIKKKKKGGAIEISFFTEEDMNELIQYLRNFNEQS